MGRTLHRRDISSSEFNLLARFCYALNTLQDNDGRLPCDLGVTEIWLPVWYKAGNWKLAIYKSFRMEAIGLEITKFRRICKYLNVKEAELIRTLHKFSILSVVAGQKYYDSPKFRMPFWGQPIDSVGSVIATFDIGFVLEKRRAMGAFR